MPDKKVVPVRFYARTDKDLIEWLEGLATGRGNDTIKAMLRAGIAAAQSGNGSVTQSASYTSIATLDPASLQATFDGFLPRIREIMDASLASADFGRTRSETVSENENIASPDILKGHLLSDDEDE